jgi:hypothetical protein
VSLHFQATQSMSDTVRSSESLISTRLVQWEGIGRQGASRLGLFLECYLLTIRVPGELSFWARGLANW